MRFQIACAAALLAVATACSNAPSAPISGSQIAPSDRTTTLAGTILTMQADTGSTILLITAAGDSVVLLGPVALAASQTAGHASLWVTGVLSPPNEMWVSAYQTEAETPYGCSPQIMAQAGFMEPPCQDGALTRRRR